MGLWSPVPWYYEYFQAADRANCKPWELIDDWTPREFWFEAAKIVLNAESDHNAAQRESAERNQARQAQAGGVKKALGRVRR